MARTLPTMQLGEFLQDRARAAEPVFYNDLARTFGLPPVTDAWLSHPLREIFDRLDRDDHDNSRPFRTAMVMKKSDGVPGKGFFKTVASLLGVYVPRDDVARIEFWKREFDKVVQFYQAG